MNKVYVVTTGEYEAYHICGVFSTPELAQAAIDSNAFELGPGDWDGIAIEEWPIDEIHHTSTFDWLLSRAR